MSFGALDSRRQPCEVIRKSVLGRGNSQLKGPEGMSLLERQGASEQHVEVGAEEASEMGHVGTWQGTGGLFSGQLEATENLE